VKILLLAGFADSLVNFRGSLMNCLQAAGHTVLAAAPPASDRTGPELHRLGVQFFPVNICRTGTNPVADLRSLLSILRLLRHARPDVLLAYTVKPVIYGSIAARVARIPCVYSMITGLGSAFSSNDGKGQAIRALAARLYSFALRKNRAVFFQNQDDLQYFRERKLIAPAMPAVVLNGSGVDLDFFPEAPPVTDGPVFILVARLLREKGVLEYAKAAAILKARYHNASFRLLGPFEQNSAGVSPDEVKQWTSAGAIEYLGSTSDVRPALASSSVFVLPTFYREGTPRSILEALALGKPIITTDWPGCRNTVIQGQNGFLVPIKDVSKLKEAMARFIEEPGLISGMGRKSREIAVEKYDVRMVNGVILRTMGFA
jgi:glycosyltransferase involved in cell wall biosynthesis